MLKLIFYDEEPITVNFPSKYDELKKIISKNYGFSKEDVDEFIFSIIKDGNKIYLNNDFDFLELFIDNTKNCKNEKGILDLFIEINQESKLYKESLKEINCQEINQVDGILSNKSLTRNKSFDKDDILNLKNENNKSFTQFEETIIESKINKNDENEKSFLTDYSNILDNKYITQSVLIDDYPNNNKNENNIKLKNNFENTNYKECIQRKKILKKLVDEEKESDLSHASKNSILDKNDYQNKIRDLEVAEKKFQMSKALSKSNEKDTKSVNNPLDYFSYKDFINSSKKSNINNDDVFVSIPGQRNIEEMVNALFNAKMNNFKHDLLSSISDEKFENKKLRDYNNESKNVSFSNNFKISKTENFEIRNKFDSIKEEKQIQTEEEIIRSSSSEIHNYIACNICGESPIVGIRYKCTKCPNYDMCERCEMNKFHDLNHALIKIRKSELNEDGVPNFRFVNNIVQIDQARRIDYNEAWDYTCFNN